MPASNPPSGGGPYLRACLEILYSNGSIVFHCGRQSGFTPEHAFRFNSQICPPPSRTETYPQSARRRNPARPSITFLLCETACAWEPDVVIVILWSLEILPALLRQAPRAPAQETRSCCRLGKHCGQR